MLDPEKIVKVAIKFGATDAVVTVQESLTKQTKFVNNEIEVQKMWEEKEAELFVAVKGSIAIGLWDGVSMKDFVKRTVTMAKMSSPNEDFKGIAEGPFKYKKIKGIFDKRIDSVPLVEYANASIESALASGADRCTGAVYADYWKTSIATSNSVYAQDQGTGLNASIRAFCGKGSGHSVSISRNAKGFDPSSAGEDAGRIASISSNPSQGKAGTYDIVFSPLAIGNVLDNIGNALSAFSVESGYSCFTGKLGKMVASGKVTLSDSGNTPSGFGSRPFDEEGFPTKTTPIIERGVLKTFLHSTSTAKKSNLKSTGNAGIISPHPWNIVLDEGKKTQEGLISEVNRGIYVTNVWYTRFANYVDGTFSTIPRDGLFEIRDGEITGSLQGLRLSDNIPNILQNVDGIAGDAKQVKWWHEVATPVTTPHVLCRKLKMTASK